MLREEKIPLPQAVIEFGLQNQKDGNFSPYAEQAIHRIINGTAGERIAFMQAALPFTANEDEIYGYPCVIDSSLVKSFFEFCKMKGLNEVVLITGAIMAELKMIDIPDVASNDCTPKHKKNNL